MGYSSKVLMSATIITMLNQHQHSLREKTQLTQAFDFSRRGLSRHYFQMQPGTKEEHFIMIKRSA